jgi:hypothetical protein
VEVGVVDDDKITTIVYDEKITLNDDLFDDDSSSRGF